MAYTGIPPTRDPLKRVLGLIAAANRVTEATAPSRTTGSSSGPPSGGGGIPAGSAYATVQDDGTSAVQRTKVNFRGSAFTVTDDAVNLATLVDVHARLEGISDTLSTTAGLVTQTSANTFTPRTITGPAAGITVSNGSGAAGNPTLALADDLAALEALSGTGFAERTGANTWALSTVGDVVGPGSAVDENVAVFDGTTGKLIKDSGVSLAGITNYWDRTVTTLSPATADDVVYVDAGTGTGGIAAVQGVNTDGTGLAGTSTNSFGVTGSSNSGIGVRGESADSTGVAGISTDGNGVTGDTGAGNDIYGGSFDRVRAGDYADFDEGAAPATPEAGDVRLYAKSDGLLYSKDDAGAEQGPFVDYSASTGLTLSGSYAFAIDSTVTTLTGSQTLTNKTLTDPLLNGKRVSTRTETGASYTLDADDCMILYNYAAGTATLNLPAAASHTGRIYYIRNIDASNLVTLDANASELINKATTMNVPPGFGMVLGCDGTGWWTF